MKLTRRRRAGSASTRSVEASVSASDSDSGASRTDSQHSSIWAIILTDLILTDIDMIVKISTAIDRKETPWTIPRVPPRNAAPRAAAEVKWAATVPGSLGRRALGEF